MQATADHLSLETCKLLKGCGVESEYYYIGYKTFIKLLKDSDNSRVYIVNLDDFGEFYESIDGFNDAIPCYTWSDVLWKHADNFLDDMYGLVYDENQNKSSILKHSHVVIDLLQQEKYAEADHYFRTHCILIPQSKNA